VLIEERWALWEKQLGIEEEIVKSYSKYLELGRRNQFIVKEIAKDIHRTFSQHPYFNDKNYGFIGQTALHQVLIAYSEYNPKVEYCQGMNFVAGFILLINGGQEDRCFGFLASLLNTRRIENEPVMDGLRGLSKKNFPLLHK
jgi:hypothetical protein